ncbi:MAG: methylated-DNA--[protein]-cysteine S-methyltransferase [Candidatus Adiutrix sp.]
MLSNCFFYDTAIGNLGLVEANGFLTGVFFATDDNFQPINGAGLKESPLLKEAAKQITQYLNGELRDFTLPLKPHGTEFQQQVWQALLAIPYGETCTYKQLAQAIGCPKASRAVGQANNKNPIAIIIPCHRVIGVSGNLVGYAGGLDLKARLIAIEQ